MLWVVEHLVPPGVEVEHATTLDEVQTILRDHPPQAALFNLRSASRPWQEVDKLCHKHKPRIPTLFRPCTYVRPAEMGMPEDAENYCPTELTARELQRHILRLIAAAGAESSPVVGEKSAARRRVTA